MLGTTGILMVLLWWPALVIMFRATCVNASTLLLRHIGLRLSGYYYIPITTSGKRCFVFLNKTLCLMIAPVINGIVLPKLIELCQT